MGLMTEDSPTLPLSGPSLPPASGRPPRKLVVLLHGLGADGQDLIGLAPHWAPHLPDAEFVAPNAPHPCDMAPWGYQWFSLQDRSMAQMAAGARAVAGTLDAFLDQALAERGLSDGDLALVGFSQGTMMSLHVALRRARPCAAVVGYSGALIAPEALPAEITARPPVLLIHGAADEVVPPQALPIAVGALEGAGVPVRHAMRPGLGHSIDGEGLALGLAFLTEHLG